MRKHCYCKHNWMLLDTQHSNVGEDYYHTAVCLCTKKFRCFEKCCYIHNYKRVTRVHYVYTMKWFTQCLPVLLFGFGFSGPSEIYYKKYCSKHNFCCHFLRYFVNDITLHIKAQILFLYHWNVYYRSWS